MHELFFFFIFERHLLISCACKAISSDNDRAIPKNWGGICTSSQFDLINEF